MEDISKRIGIDTNLFVNKYHFLVLEKISQSKQPISFLVLYSQIESKLVHKNKPQVKATLDFLIYNDKIVEIQDSNGITYSLK